MKPAEERLLEALSTLAKKPLDTAKATTKKRYSELISERTAHAFADELRHRGLKGARPAGPGETEASGAERRMSGGIGAKKVDVTWATEASGLLLAVSIKSINFRDLKTGNYQKNLTNRRGDMLFEAVTLHRRFPYAVLAGFFFLDRGAEHDHTQQRQSTFLNAHDRLQLFTGREDPWGRDEQYERLYIGLMDADPFHSSVELSLAGEPGAPVSVADAFDDLIRLVARRNPDFYRALDGTLKPV